MLMDIGTPNPRNFAELTSAPLPQGSENSTRTAQTWIKNCLTNHDQCGPGGLASLPRRILDLGQDDEKVFLIEPLTISARYVCQSYCWGVSRTVITTKDTLGLHKAGIRIDDLPRTFRDTITFTKNLGLRYLWIDSLCIIQDSIVDWREEAAKMGSYYGNAYLTIAATMSISADGGLFQAPTSITLSSSTQTWAVREKRHLSRANASLFRRGWIFQERLLSPRVIHFAATEMVYECNEHAVCECGQDMPDSTWQIKQEHLNGMKGIRIMGQDRRPDMWHRIVEAYCKLLLTNPNDKMPALSGIADKFRDRRTGSKYVAGLWEATLLKDLCWRSDAMERRFVAPWRAPTWSWASHYNAVKYGNYPDLDVEFTKVIDCNCKWVPPSTTGEIESAYLILEGPVILGAIRNGRFLFELERKGSVSGMYFPDWSIHEEELLVIILRLGQDTWGMGKEYLLVLKEVLRVGEGVGDSEVFERVGLHEFSPLGGQWNQMRWGLAENKRMRIV